MTDPARTTRTGTILVTIPEAAAKLSVPVGTIYSWASRQQITPKSVLPGGQPLYNLTELEERARKTKRRGRGGHA